jgi:hypothetical protein
MDVGAQFLDADHGTIAGVPEISQSIAYSTTQSTYISQYMITSNVSTTNARYLRVRIAPARTSGSGTNPSIHIAAVVVQPVISYGNTYIKEGTLTLDGGKGIGWWDGATVDTVLTYVAGSSGRVRLYRPLFSGGASLWIDNDNDASLSSTNHGLTIGPLTGSNIKIDGNEILSVNNGAAASLFVNQDSDTYIGGDSSTGVWISGNHNLIIQQGFLQIFSQTQPGSPAANGVRLYVDTSAGKERVRVVFDDGSRVTLATQP